MWYNNAMKIFVIFALVVIALDIIFDVIATAQMEAMDESVWRDADDLYE